MSEPDHESIQVLAGEYVLGVLDAEEAAVVERQLASDPHLASAVQRWQDDLAPLAMTAPPIKVGEETWDRISASLRALTPAASSERTLRLWPAKREGTARFRGSVWSSLAFWRMTGLAGVAAALVLAYVAFLSPLPDREARPIAMTVLEDEQGRPGWVVQAFADNTIEVTPMQTPDLPPERVLQLWTLRDPAEGPLPLGLVPRAGVHRIDLGELPQPVPGQLFEISEEPPGGSPYNRPSGAVLVKGNIALVPR
ncbi:anti-sigma factor [Marinivivus vitaminiproducens]|uniref:anti-sigma factor n=1 Tax=Marinivivus vitaminiproducens TaxID=3035935 RepID=UPI0027996FEC|nr:anti-sigma factor [Geminicoccaceae bacterium SCSIO 64248]